MNEQKLKITPEQAIELLSPNEQIHTFRNPRGVLIGCDWSRDKIIETLKQHPTDIEIGGEMCKKLGHALIVWTPDEPLFIEADKEKVEELERLST